MNSQNLLIGAYLETKYHYSVLKSNGLNDGQYGNNVEDNSDGKYEEEARILELLKIVDKV